MAADFAPFTTDGLATTGDDGTITATVPVAHGLRLLSAEVVDQAFLVCVFERTDAEGGA